MLKIKSVRHARTISATSRLVLLAGCALAQFARADLPVVLDRVPAQTPIVMAMNDLGKSFAAFERMGNLFSTPGADMSELQKAREFLNKPGFNTNGSMAMLVYPKKQDQAAAKPDAPADDDADDFFGDEESMTPPADMIALLPVSDYRAFVKSLGAEAGAGVTRVTIDENEAYIRDIGSGFAAMSNTKELVEGFRPAEKMLQTHTQALGESCRRIAESSQVFMVADMSVLRQDFEKGLEEMSDRVEQGAMMAPGADQAIESLKMMEKFAKDWARDATFGIIGMGFGEKGMWIDLGSQFREGSQHARTFSVKGNAGALVSKLPRQPFLFAGAIDMSHAPLKQMMMDMRGRKTDPEDTSPLSLMSDQADGMSFFVGESPAGIAGGLFANTAVFVSTKEPRSQLDTMATKFNQTPAQAKGGRKPASKSSYTKSADEVEGSKIDRWQVQNQLDQNDPNFMMANMMQTMLYGSPIVQGYAAATESGVVTTYSKSKLLMGAMLRAGGDNSLQADADVKAAAAMLPPDRFFEMYVGVKPMLEMAQGAMAMMMPVEFDVPGKVSNIAIGASASGGGLQVRLYLPDDALKAFEAVGKAMREAQGEMMEQMGDDEDGDGAPPRF